VIGSRLRLAGKFALTGALGAACLLLVCNVSRADERTLAEAQAQYFRELRRRGLFQLAERFCTERLSHGGLSSTARTDLTIELSKTFVEHAEFVGGSEQDELWSRSDTVLAELLKSDPDNPRRLLVEVQQSLTRAAIGHSRQLIASLDPHDAASRKRATETLQAAINGLRTAETEISARSRKKSTSRTPAAGEIRLYELRPLLGNVRCRLAAAQIDLAQLLPAGSADQRSLATEAQKVLKTISEAEDGELIWQARMAFVECSRILADYPKTLREITAFEKLEPPAEFADRLLAERVRVLTSQREFGAAALLIEEREKDPRPVTGELQSLVIELAIANWRTAKKGAGAQIPPRVMQSLEARVARLRRDVGGYWMLRSDLLLRQVRDVQELGPELAELAAQAQAAFNAGESDQAIGLYGKAQAAAGSAGRDDLAFQFGFTRASIEIKTQSWDAAAADLIDIAEKYPKDPKAAQAHLLAAYALGKAYADQPTDERRNEFTRFLAAHREQYPDDPTIHEANWMLAELEERRGQSEAALDAYRLIPLDHKRGPAAQLATARCFEQILDHQRERGEPTSPWEDEAVATLQKMLSSPTDSRAPLTVQQAEIALRLARILLHRNPPQFELADRWLARIVEEPNPVPEKELADTADANAGFAPLKAAARQLQVISLAGQGKFQPARKLLRQLSVADPAALLRILDGLTPLRSDERRDPFRDLGELQLEVALQLNDRRAELSKADQRRLDECLAQGFFATGQSQRGFEIYESLLRKSPRDRELLLAYARWLARCGSSECLTQAVAVWRKLEGLHEPGTRDWYPMRYELCKALLAAGQPAEARKLLQVTRLVFQKPADEGLQKRFADLEVEANRAPAK
jgi:TolA-binding protein